MVSYAREKCQSQYNLLCKIDISTENEMNIQLRVTSLFGSARQNVAICGHNVPSIHYVKVLSILWPWFLESTLHSCCSSHTRHAQAQHCCFCLDGRALVCRPPECQAETWTGWACVECRSGWERAGSVTNWIRRLRSGAWLAWPLNHDHSSISRGQRGLCSFVINAHCPCVDKPLKMTHQQQHSDLNLCPVHRCGLLGLMGHNVFSRFVSHLFWSHSCVKWRPRATQVRDWQLEAKVFLEYAAQ